MHIAFKIILHPALDIIRSRETVTKLYFLFSDEMTAQSPDEVLIVDLRSISVKIMVSQLNITRTIIKPPQCLKINFKDNLSTSALDCKNTVGGKGCYPPTAATSNFLSTMKLYLYDFGNY